MYQGLIVSISVMPTLLQSSHYHLCKVRQIVCVCVCVHVCMRVCMHARIHVCVFVCMFVKTIMCIVGCGLWYTDSIVCPPLHS